MSTSIGLGVDLAFRRLDAWASRAVRYRDARAEAQQLDARASPWGAPQPR